MLPIAIPEAALVETHGPLRDGRASDDRHRGQPTRTARDSSSILEDASCRPQPDPRRWRIGGGSRHGYGPVMASLSRSAGTAWRVSREAVSATQVGTPGNPTSCKGRRPAPG